MKYIKNLFNFKKSQIILPEEKLYTSLTEDQYYDFTFDHEVINCDNSVINSIKNFMKSSESLKNIKYDIMIFKNYDIEEEDRSGKSKIDENTNYSDRIILDLFKLEHNSNHNGLQNLVYMIDKFDDDWFLVKIGFLMHSYEHFKCDTIDGVYQLILNYKNYIKNKSL